VLSGAVLSTPFDGGRIQAVERWRTTIAASGMAGWAAEMMPMRFVEGDVEPAIYNWVCDLQASCSAIVVCEQASSDLPRLRYASSTRVRNQ
jgi:3-oxoadipate enol-lactonase